MGPHAKRDGNNARTDLARGQVAPASVIRQAPSADQVEWSSPTSIRARSRPSNLHSYLRSNASFPLVGAAASPRPRRIGGGSGSSNGGASPREPRTRAARKTRSQSTRSTQTSASGVTTDSAAPPSALGALEDIQQMALETVDFFIRALEDRRGELRAEEEKDAQSYDGDTNTRPRETESHMMAPSPSRTSATPEGDELVSHHDTPSGAPVPSQHGPRGITRSRSYETIVQLEQILEGRHQQLMQDGVLDPSASLSLHGILHSDLTEEIRKLQQSIRRDARDQR